MSERISAKERRKQVVIGDLPETFLRLDCNPTSQSLLEQDAQLAAAYSHQMQTGHAQSSVNGRLTVTVVEAKLTKNYGLTRMDPYARITIGNSVFETHTDGNGAKNPHWAKSVQCYLSSGISAVYIEVFDEKAFTTDDRIAWCHVPIPPSVLEGNSLDDWYPLNGKQGDEKEGTINIVLSYTPVTAPPVMYAGGAPMVFVHPQYFVPPQAVVGQQPALQQPAAVQPPQPLFTEDDVKVVAELFETVDIDVVRSVFEEKRGNTDAIVSSLLEMTSE